MSGGGTRDSLEAAQEAARDARTRLSDTVCQIKARLQPSALVGQARERIKEEVTLLTDKATTTAGDRPALVGLTAGAVLLFFLRKPLGRVIGRMFTSSTSERPAS
jgi:hypothetical protein